MRKPSFLLLSAAASILLVGCGSSEFSAGEGAAGAADAQVPDQSVGTDAPADHSGKADAKKDGPSADAPQDVAVDAPTDGPSDQDAGPDVVVDAPPCEVLQDAGTLTDLYVDQRFAGLVSNGSQQCPFKTIVEAADTPLTLGTKRTIHVAGQALPNPLTYNETQRVAVGANVTLLGEGPDRVTISASGANCAGGNICAVHVVTGGVLDGFTVTSPGGYGVIASGQNAPKPWIKNTAANNSLLDGILAQGAVTLGPGMQAMNNGASGVNTVAQANPTALVITNDVNHPNAFDHNAGHGIDVLGGFYIEFGGGSASSNGNCGVRLDQASASGGHVNVVMSLTAQSDGNNGLCGYGGSLLVRKSTLVSNTNSGLVFNYDVGTTLNIGTPNSLGGNVFHVANGQNNKVGVFLCGAPGPGSQVAEGNTWSACAPTTVSEPACGTYPGSYTDIAYTLLPDAGAGAPVPDP